MYVCVYMRVQLGMYTMVSVHVGLYVYHPNLLLLPPPHLPLPLPPLPPPLPLPLLHLPLPFLHSTPYSHFKSFQSCKFCDVFLSQSPCFCTVQGYTPNQCFHQSFHETTFQSSP